MKPEILIIGGGPAGCVAALFAAKAKRNVTIIHKGDTPLIRTFHWLLPGFPGDFGPAEWSKALHAQIKERGISIIGEEVTEATLGASEKRIVTSSGTTWEASAIILAVGCYDRHGFIEGEEKFAGHGVHYNAYQDGLWFDGKTVVVEGKTDQAVRETLYLTRFAEKIYFIVPAMKLEADEKSVKILQGHPKVAMLLSASIKKIDGETAVDSVTVLSAGDEKQFKADAIFLYARQSIPQYKFLKGTIEISEEGAVLVDEQMMTSIPGVFACGDMLAGIPQLPLASATQGIIAAMSADRYLTHLEP